MAGNSKVSIIIAVYNGAKTLEACLRSIETQSYPHIEIIVMDGGSQDGTYDLLQTNNEIITYWESKKDNGIYHAWNNALNHVTGEWVCFLGADDKFAYPDVIQDMLDLSGHDQCNYISAKIAVDFKGRVAIKGKPWNKKMMQKWHVTAHPGSLHHKSLFEEYSQFNECYKIAGDYEFLLRSQSSIRACFLDKVTVLMGGDGVSNVNFLPAFIETFKIQKQNKEIGLFKAGYNFSIAMLKAVVRKIIY